MGKPEIKPIAIASSRNSPSLKITEISKARTQHVLGFFLTPPRKEADKNPPYTLGRYLFGG
jgi:hypothetical protein